MLTNSLTLSKIIESHIVPSIIQSIFNGKSYFDFKLCDTNMPSITIFREPNIGYIDRSLVYNYSSHQKLCFIVYKIIKIEINKHYIDNYDFEIVVKKIKKEIENIIYREIIQEIRSNNVRLKDIVYFYKNIIVAINPPGDSINVSIGSGILNKT